MTEITWKGHTLYTGVGSTVKVGDFVATESGLYEFFFADSPHGGGYIPVCILDEIVGKWHTLNDVYIDQMDKDLKELA